MLEKAKNFFEKEYKSTEWYLKNRTLFLLSDAQVKEGTVQRCLGVAQFVQQLGVSFEEISPIYDEYKEKIESL